MSASLAQVGRWGRRCLASSRLLLQRRTAFFLAADSLVIGVCLVNSLVSGGRWDQLWYGLVLIPVLILGVPVLADVIDVERRVGSLDLALSSPGAAGYFERRLAGAGSFLLLQAWVVVGVTWLTSLSRPFPLLVVALHALLLVVLVLAVVLFWAVRLRGPGAVTFASYLTLALLARWALPHPFPNLVTEGSGYLIWPLPAGHVWRTLVLTGAVVLLHAYSRRRLRRPELLLS